MRRITLRKTAPADIITPIEDMVGIFVDEDGKLARVDEDGNVSQLEGLVSMSSAPPLSGGVAVPGVSVSASRGDHVHPAVDLNDTSETSGALPLARGGLGISLSDPNADRIFFWDDSAGQSQWLDIGSGLSISGTTLSTSGVVLSSAIGATVQAHGDMLDDIAVLADPGADRLMFWDESAGEVTWLSLGVGLSITGTTINASGGGGGGGLVDGDYGDITVGGGGATMAIDAGTVTLGKMANLAANSFIGNNTGGGATPIALSVAQAKSLLGLGALATENTVNGSVWSGADLALSDGGTGASLNDPGADRIMFWDDSDGAVDWLTVGSGLSLVGKTLSVASGSTPWAQIGATVTTSGAGPWSFTGIPTSYSDLLLLIKLTVAGSGAVSVAVSPDGSTWAAGANISPSAVSDGIGVGGVFVPGYNMDFGTINGAVREIAASPFVTPGTSPLAWWCDGGISAIRAAISGGTASDVEISLWGR